MSNWCRFRNGGRLCRLRCSGSLPIPLKTFLIEFLLAADTLFDQQFQVLADAAGDPAAATHFLTAGGADLPWSKKLALNSAALARLRWSWHSGMVARAQKLDELRSKPYWATNVEMAARSYERYILDRAEAKGIRNDYLVNLKKVEEHGNPATYAYPTEAELNNGVRDAFDTLFKTLKTKPTDRGVAFYSKDGLDIGGGNIIAEDNF
ncbi:LPD1 domain-containing protein, partial [Serratia plymuthica]|uniref:LPD1 domain-containing protein n=1 Tax=Serratia plymuthica TaxID=82996 RepID=UPI00095CF690